MVRFLTRETEARIRIGFAVEGMFSVFGLFLSGKMLCSRGLVRVQLAYVACCSPQEFHSKLGGS